MGCDIHMCVEFKRNKWSESIGWRCGDYFHTPNPLDPECEPIRVDLYDWRCYSLFAVLANVRNRGCEAAYPYISPPKGLPKDVTEYVKKEYESWGFDAHSCSHLTMREIVEFHEENKPKNDFGGYILERLIYRLRQRADELGVIYDFELDHPITDEVRRKMENIRIVFWFDN